MSTINPYSFVPLQQGAGPQRSAPRGHAQLSPQCWSGTIAVELEAESRLLLGGDDEHPGPLRQLDPAGSPTGPVIIPGSTMAGAVRSIHEALTDSCLRIVDLEYVAVHRHSAHPGSTKNLRLGIVSALDGQLPSSVQLLTRTVRLHSDLFETGSGKRSDRTHHDGNAISSGDRLAISDAVVARAKERELDKLKAQLNTDEGRRQRARINGQMVAVEKRPSITRGDTRGGDLQEDSAGKWVVLVSDTAARDPQYPVWWVAADTTSHEGAPLAVGEDARKALARAIEGADDLHGTEELTGTYVNAYNPNQLLLDPDETIEVIGRRYRVHPGMFHAGMPVWVEIDPETKRVVALRLASLWRRAVPGRMSERLGGYQPCGSPQKNPSSTAGDASTAQAVPVGGLPELCPSCRLFGAAHASDFGYRGHIRFSDAVAVTNCIPRPIEVPQLYSPKPTASQFYLSSNSVGQARAQFPLANWGPEPQSDRVRPIRGRKFYWAGTTQHATFNAAGPSEQVWVIEPNPAPRFKATVTFDNIDSVQLRSLLAALNPALLWPKARGRIGGGRPFGWGVMKVTATSMACWSSDRYTGQSTAVAAPDLPTALAVNAETGILADTTQLTALEHLLTPGFVPAADVRYPEISHWADTSGLKRRGGDAVLSELPAANLPASRQGLR